MLLLERIIGEAKILESDRTKLPDGVLCRVKEPVCNVDQLNANKRKYGWDVWEKVMNNQTLTEQMQKRALFGHAEHPATSQSDLQLVSHTILEWVIDKPGNTVYQVFDVFDTPTGRIVDCLLRAQCKVGVSTRAEGELTEEVDETTKQKYQRVIAEKYKYITTDFTADPSTFGAVPIEVKRNVVTEIKAAMGSDKATVNDKKFAGAILESMHCKDKAKCQHCGCCDAIKEATVSIVADPNQGTVNVGGDVGAVNINPTSTNINPGGAVQITVTTNPPIQLAQSAPPVEDTPVEDETPEEDEVEDGIGEKKVNEVQGSTHKEAMAFLNDVTKDIGDVRSKEWLKAAMISHLNNHLTSSGHKVEAGWVSKLVDDWFANEGVEESKVNEAADTNDLLGKIASLRKEIDAVRLEGWERTKEARKLEKNGSKKDAASKRTEADKIGKEYNRLRKAMIKDLVSSYDVKIEDSKVNEGVKIWTEEEFQRRRAESNDYKALDAVVSFDPDRNREEISSKIELAFGPATTIGRDEDDWFGVIDEKPFAIVSSDGTVELSSVDDETIEKIAQYMELETQWLQAPADSVPNESKSVNNLLKDMTQLKIDAATIRADRDRLAEAVNEMSDTDLQLRIAINKLHEMKIAEGKETVALRTKLEERAAVAAEATKKLTEATAAIATLNEKVKEMTVGNKKNLEENKKKIDSVENGAKKALVEQVNKAKTDATRAVIVEYVGRQLKAFKSVHDNVRALLEKCMTIAEVDEVLNEFRDSQRRSALHSKPPKEITVRVDESGTNNDVRKRVGIVFEGFGMS